MGTEKLTNAEEQEKPFPAAVADVALQIPTDLGSARLTIRDAGVWRMVELHENRGAFTSIYERFDDLKDALSGLSHARRFFVEIWSIAPYYVILWSFLQIWNSFQAAISLYISAKVFNTVQAIVDKRTIDPATIRAALAMRLLHAVLQWGSQYAGRQCNTALKHRTTLLFGNRLLETYIKMDHVTARKANAQATMEKFSSPSDVLFCKGMWGSCAALASRTLTLVDILFQGSFLLLQLRTRTNGIPLVLLAVASPIVRLTLFNNGFGNVWFAYAIHSGYIRLSAAAGVLSGSSYLQELVGSNVGSTFHDMYKKGLQSLDPDFSSLNMPYANGTSFNEFISFLTGDTRMVFYLISLVIDPASSSIASFSIIEETSRSLGYTLRWALQNGSDFKKNLQYFHDYYKFLELAKESNDGDIVYPSMEHTSGCGMKIEFKNVSVRYPGSDNLALDNVSFVIPAGSTVILIGENGSGKTTTTSLINHMLEPTSGTILFDDIPARSYKASSLRDAQAVLCQESTFYPLSIAENIGIGHPSSINNEEFVREAAKHGQADEFIEELLSWERKLGPPKITLSSWGLPDSKLEEMLKKLETPVDLSGGQWQRLALARLFMRVREEREDIGLIVTDEPSAALDPHAELKIFERLLSIGKNRTRIFITHRFGHLTKHADLIICLKKGKLAEYGRHEELMEAGGEYAKLYNVQAQAFSA